MLSLLLFAALADAEPSVATKGELPVGPLVAWSQPGEPHKVRVWGVYEVKPKALDVLESEYPLRIAGRSDRNTLLVVETGDGETYWKVNVAEGEVEQSEEGFGAPVVESRPVCGDRWPPKNSGTLSIYMDPENARRIGSVKAFGFRSHPARFMHETGDPVRLKVAGLMAVLEEDHLIAFEGEDEMIWRVSDDGFTRKVAALGDDELALLSAAVASPDESLLAVGAFDRGDVTKRRLVVVDLLSGETVLERSGINVRTSERSGDPPRMELSWSGGDKVRFSETVDGGMRWVELSVPDGKETWSQTYSDTLGLRHRVPPGSACLGVDVRGGHVRSAETGGIVLAGNYKPADCVFSPNGTLAVCQDEQWIWLVDGDIGEASSLGESGAKDMVWVP